MDLLMSQKEGGDFADFQAKSPIVPSGVLRINKKYTDIQTIIHDEWQMNNQYNHTINNPSCSVVK